MKKKKGLDNIKIKVSSNIDIFLAKLSLLLYFTFEDVVITQFEKSLKIMKNLFLSSNEYSNLVN